MAWQYSFLVPDWECFLPEGQLHTGQERWVDIIGNARQRRAALERVTLPVVFNPNLVARTERFLSAS